MMFDAAACNVVMTVSGAVACNGVNAISLNGIQYMEMPGINS